MSNIKSQLYKLMSVSMLLSNSNSQTKIPFSSYNNILYSMDKEISDCEMKMYLVLLASDKDKQKKKFQEFEKAYDKLSHKKQEYIKYQYLTLCEQKENIDNIQDSIKIKKKGEDNYE